MKPSCQYSQHLLQTLLQNTPTSNSWGIATSNFSTAGFWWFKNRNVLFSFLEKALPTLEQDPDEIENFEPLLKFYHQLVRRVAEDDPDFSTVMASYNHYFKADIKLIWIGRFNELAFGYHPFSRHVREIFQQNPDPITKAGLIAFKEFLNTDVPDLKS